jgi:hypothetical protein
VFEDRDGYFPNKSGPAHEAYLIMQQNLSTGYFFQLRTTNEYAERLIKLLKKEYKGKE